MPSFGRRYHLWVGEGQNFTFHYGLDVLAVSFGINAQDLANEIECQVDDCGTIFDGRLIGQHTEWLMQTNGCSFQQTSKLLGRHRSAARLIICHRAFRAVQDVGQFGLRQPKLLTTSLQALSDVQASPTNRDILFPDLIDSERVRAKFDI